ncbi:hypothetical protein KBH77_02480 [Patescibacteria group bacterium]|jgi:hypothetical protein|nr:hypothetical protein [Patescibacteria group bacterium]
MALQKYLKPVEYSFHVWMRSIREQSEPVGVNYFFTFVKNVCVFNATKWQKQGILRERILKEVPDIDTVLLEEYVDKFFYCIDFYKTNPYRKGFSFTNERVPRGCYLEKSFKNGEFIEKYKPVPRIC